MKAKFVLDFEKPTRNGRVYTEEVLQKMLDDEITQERLKNKLMFLRLNGRDGDYATIDVRDIVGIVDSISLDGTKMHCTTELLRDYTGLEVAPVMTGITSCICDIDVEYAVPDNLICFDIVPHSAIRGAKLTGLNDE